MKKQLGLATLVLALTSCLTVGGHLEVAYVPWRCDDYPKKNEVKTELDAHANIELNKGYLQFGTTFRSYENFPDKESNYIFFDSTRQEYDIYAKYLIDNLEFYMFHNCSHPVKDEEPHFIDYNNNDFYLNHDDTTEIGVKLKW